MRHSCFQCVIDLCARMEKETNVTDDTHSKVLLPKCQVRFLIGQFHMRMVFKKGHHLIHVIKGAVRDGGGVEMEERSELHKFHGVR